MAQEDVDAALDQLTDGPRRGLPGRLADPSIATVGRHLFDRNAVLGESTPSEDPTAFVGQEVESFSLGWVPRPRCSRSTRRRSRPIAETLVRARWNPAHELVAGSIEVEVGKPTVTGGSIEFQASATGRQIAILDPAELRGLVLGKPLAAAREILAPYGRVELTAWPDWVVSVPTVPDRVTSASSAASRSRLRRRRPGRQPVGFGAVTRLLGIDLGERRIGARHRRRRRLGRAPAPTLRRACARGARCRHAGDPDRAAWGRRSWSSGLPLEASGAEGPQSAITRTGPRRWPSASRSRWGSAMSG